MGRAALPEAEVETLIVMTAWLFNRDSLDDLTPQELQIVQMVAQGLSNRVIAERLYLSRRTVESHLYRMFPKLGVSSRAQLVSLLGPRLGTAI